jgi:hypothetical protein
MKRESAILIHRLEPDKLYTASAMAELLYQRGTRDHRRVTARMLNFMRHHGVPADASPNAWYGKNVQDCLDPHYRYLAAESLNLLTALRGVAARKAFSETAERQPTEVEQESSAPKLFRFPGRRRLLLVAILPVVLGIVATASAVRPTVMQVLERYGLGAARAYQLEPDQLKRPRDIYQSAWLDIRDGAPESAERKAFLLLSREDIDDKFKGDNFYLLGELRAKADEPGISVNYFSLAYDHYFELDHQPGLYQASLGMAKTYILMGETEAGARFLEQALVHFEQSEPGIVSIDNYETWAIRLHSRMGDFHAARLIAERRLDRVMRTENLDDLASAFSDLGFWAALDGDCATGYQYSVRAQKLIQEIDDPRKDLYNSLNFLLLGRCENGEPDAWLVERITRDVHQEGSPEILRYLDLALYSPISP